MTLPRITHHLSILGVPIQIDCDNVEYADLVQANFETFAVATAMPALHYVMVRQHGHYVLTLDGHPIGEVRPDDAPRYVFLYTLEKSITIELQRRRQDLLFIHASALERDGRVYLIAAASGTGKSTTTWALLQRGFTYLSDELAPIDPKTRLVHAYPHAVCLKTPPPKPFTLPDGIVQTERTIHVPVSALSAKVGRLPAPLGALVFLQRDRMAPKLALNSLSPGQAVARLYANALNALAHSGEGLDPAVEIATSVPAYLLEAADLTQTCDLFSQIRCD